MYMVKVNGETVGIVRLTAEQVRKIEASDNMTVKEV